ncbi:MAG: M48 family metallopeptidase [Saprospiraceae bacterium]|nr:M48 family metallopeptidase [Candidatus Vicinibacter affinis]
MLYQAVYYSGIKPKGQPVSFSIEDEEIKILDEEGEILSLWNKELLSRQNYKTNHLLIKWGTRDPFEYLEVREELALEALNEAFPQKNFFKNPGFSWGGFYSILGLVVLSTLVLLFYTYFFGLPRLTQWASEKVPIEWELKIGQSGIDQYSNSPSLDTLKTQYLNEFYQLLNHQSAYHFNFSFLKDSTVNAFALPGGFIVVNKGILDKMTNYRQLVGLMGHEIAHVEERHTLKTMFKSLGAYMIIQLALGHLGAISGVVVENLSSIQNLSYSREFELSADKAAFHLMKNLNISPSRIVDLFGILALEEANNKSSLPEFMSTHPLTEERSKRIKALIKENPLSGSEVEYPQLQEIFEKLKI